jgi:hypothetical protein
MAGMPDIRHFGHYSYSANLRPLPTSSLASRKHLKSNGFIGQIAAKS